MATLTFGTATATYTKYGRTGTGTASCVYEYSMADNGTSVTVSGTLYNRIYCKTSSFTATSKLEDVSIFYGSPIWVRSYSGSVNVLGTVPGQTSNQDIGNGTKSFTVTKTKSTQIVTITAYGMCFCTVASGAGGEGRNSTNLQSQTITIPALASYTVSYNANGGSGAPANQTKWYGEALTLSSAIPTRDGYKFTGWNTAHDGSGTSYSAGASYTVNSAVTLYAQWDKVTSKVKVKIDGEWIDGEIKCKVNGEWVNATEVYVKIGGEWVEIS